MRHFPEHLVRGLRAGTAMAAVLSWPSLAFAQSAPPATHLRSTVEDVRVEATRRRSADAGLIKPQHDDKSVSTVSQAFIATQAPIQNAYQYVGLTPGALIQMSDPFGLSRQLGLNIHGLGQDEIGYPLAGMPLSDIGYYDGYPGQFIDSENIDEISLAQGTADLDSPVISEAGGLTKITMLDPSLHPGGSVDASHGSFDTDRAFIRLDTGLIGNSGLARFSPPRTRDRTSGGAGTRQAPAHRLQGRARMGRGKPRCVEWRVARSDHADL